MQTDLLEKILGRPARDLGEAEKRILRQARERKTVSSNASDDFIAEASLGDRLADQIARVGGSWTFILCFLAFLVFWAATNTVLLTSRAFDPYPFIFLNLLLSMVAAIQAPIIMMSQNRQAERDRFFAAKDYEVNLKAEIEVLGLHHKIDMQVLKELHDLRQEFAALMQEVRNSKGAQ